MRPDGNLQAFQLCLDSLDAWLELGRCLAGKFFRPSPVLIKEPVGHPDKALQLCDCLFGNLDALFRALVLEFLDEARCLVPLLLCFGDLGQCFTRNLLNLLPLLCAAAGVRMLLHIVLGSCETRLQLQQLLAEAACGVLGLRLDLPLNKGPLCLCECPSSLLLGLVGLLRGRPHLLGTHRCQLGIVEEDGCCLDDLRGQSFRLLHDGGGLPCHRPLLPVQGLGLQLRQALRKALQLRLQRLHLARGFGTHRCREPLGLNQLAAQEHSRNGCCRVGRSACGLAGLHGRQGVLHRQL
mmetsp:Transcript_92663/g.167451  ORF Transcript_92663/g.167451 Transcript_92663/m.167451 type:complete len:295 (-) Transcript_92663:123-1007(-)